MRSNFCILEEKLQKILIIREKENNFSKSLAFSKVKHFRIFQKFYQTSHANYRNVCSSHSPLRIVLWVICCEETKRIFCGLHLAASKLAGFAAKQKSPRSSRDAATVFCSGALLSLSLEGKFQNNGIWPKLQSLQIWHLFSLKSRKFCANSALVSWHLM